MGKKGGWGLKDLFMVSVSCYLALVLVVVKIVGKVLFAGFNKSE